MNRKAKELHLPRGFNIAPLGEGLQQCYRYLVESRALFLGGGKYCALRLVDT